MLVFHGFSIIRALKAPRTKHTVLEPSEVHMDPCEVLLIKWSFCRFIAAHSVLPCKEFRALGLRGFNERLSQGLEGFHHGV